MQTTPSRFLTLVLSILGISVFAVPVQAQTVPSAYRFIDKRMAVDVQGGYHTANQGSLGMGPKDGPIVGARWGINLSGPLALELGGWYMPTTRDVVDLERAPADQVLAEADVYLAAVLADLKILFAGARTWHRISPYAVIGGGFAFDFAGQQEADALLSDPDRYFDFGTSLLARLGAGVTWLPVQSFEVRLDGLLELWKVDTPEGWLALERDLGPLPPDEWVNGMNLTLGFGWRF